MDFDRKRIIFIFLLITVLSVHGMFCKAQSGPELSSLGVVGHNTSDRSYAGLDIKAAIPVNSWLDVGTAAEILSSGSLSLSAAAMPGISVGGGRFFLNGMILYNLGIKSKISLLSGALLAGYSRQYFSLQAGCSTKTVFDTGGSGDRIREPFDLVYRGEVKIRPRESRWNLGGAVANFTPYEMERIWNPMFFIFGNFNLNERITFLGEFQLKPIGMFSLQTTIFGFRFSAGVTYKF